MLINVLILIAVGILLLSEDGKGLLIALVIGGFIYGVLYVLFWAGAFLYVYITSYRPLGDSVSGINLMNQIASFIFLIAIVWFIKSQRKKYTGVLQARLKRVYENNRIGKLLLLPEGKINPTKLFIIITSVVAISVVLIVLGLYVLSLNPSGSLINTI